MDYFFLNNFEATFFFMYMNNNLIWVLFKAQGPTNMDKNTLKLLWLGPHMLLMVPGS